MSTTSQYYRSASNHPHYQTYPSSGHDQLYAATTWQQDTNHAPYDGPPPASFLHYNQSGGDSVSHPSSPPPGWPTGHSRQNSNVGWNQPVQSQNVVPRSLNPYGSVGGIASVLQQDHETSRQFHQHVSATRQDLPLSQPIPAYKGSDRFTQATASADFPAESNGPPFTTHAQSTHTLPQPSHPRSRHASFHLASGLQQPIQSPADIAWANNSTPSREQQYPVHSSNALEPGLGQTTSSGSGWHMEHVGSAGTITPAFHPDPTTSHQWDTTQVQTEQQTYHQQLAPFDQPSEPLGNSISSRRPSMKKKGARVPPSFVERQEKMKVSKRKGPLHDKQREKTHTMRKNKRICIRCRFYKSGCDEGDPCEKCEKITGHARSFHEPCYRQHLEDTSLVRRCNGREHQEEAEFLGYDWVYNSQLYEMEILWNLPGYGPISDAKPLRVTFRPYSPRRGSLDVAASVWTNKDGEVKAVEQPAYAIYDTANLVPAFERYFSSLQPAIEDWIFARIQQDEIATLTYTEVLRMRGSNGSKVLDLAMRLQCLSVVSQGYGSVWSNNIPGIREYDYRSLGSSDYEAYDRKRYDRPLPGAITHQMDVAAVKYLRKLEKLFVKELATLIFKPKIKPWYELFLAFYVIFWNLEYIHHGANDYMKSKNGTMIENQVNGVVTNQIKKWEFAFPVLLYHWRCTLRGYSPFKLARENPEELRERGHIDAIGFQYVVKVADIFARVDADRFQPPLTGFASTHYSLSSEWVTKLFKEAGA